MKKKLIIFTLLLSIGFSQVSVDDLKNINNQELNSLKDSFRDQDNLNESFTEPEINEINFNGTQEDKDLEYFGYNFLKKDISFFDNSILSFSRLFSFLSLKFLFLKSLFASLSFLESSRSSFRFFSNSFCDTDIILFLYQ